MSHLLGYGYKDNVSNWTCVQVFKIRSTNVKKENKIANNGKYVISNKQVG